MNMRFVILLAFLIGCAMVEAQWFGLGSDPIANSPTGEEVDTTPVQTTPVQTTPVETTPVVSTVTALEETAINSEAKLVVPKPAPTCPKTPETLLLLKSCRFFKEIMGVQKKTTEIELYEPRSLIVAVTVYCKVPDALETFNTCVDDTFKDTSCSAATKSQLHSIASDYWSRYCTNVDDNIQTLKYLFEHVPIHLVDEKWQVGNPATDTVSSMCVTSDDLQNLVINACARWYNRVIGSGSRDRPLDVYLSVASRASDIGLQCVKRRMLRATNCQSDLIYLILRSLYVFQGLPGVSMPLVYLDPQYMRQNPDATPERETVGIWSNQFVKSANRGMRYCPLSDGAHDLLTTDTIEIIGILNKDRGISSVDIRFFSQTSQQDPVVWYKGSGGQLPVTFTSAVTAQSSIRIESVNTNSASGETQVVKIMDSSVGQMVIYVIMRNLELYDIWVSATSFDLSYATGMLVHGCEKVEDIDYKAELVRLKRESTTSQFADECEVVCRDIPYVGFHASCCIGCMVNGGDARIVNAIDMLLGFDSQLAHLSTVEAYKPPILLQGTGSQVASTLFSTLMLVFIFNRLV